MSTAGALSFDSMLEKFQAYTAKIRHFSDAISCLAWDARTGMPRKGVGHRAEVIGTLSAEMFAMTTSPQMEEFIRFFSDPQHAERLDAITKALVRECRKEWERSKKIPPELYREYVVLTSEAESVWEEAKSKSDFLLFRPYLEKIVTLNIRFADYWGFAENRYDALLEYYEPDMTVKRLDALFADMREKMVPLLDRIKGSRHRPDTGFFRRYADPRKQREWSMHILQKMGYDFEAGRLDESVHPFAVGLNPGDVRITTHFYENDIRSAMFSSMHEGGHALYEQNISPDLAGTLLCTGTSMGIHESQSRFWENMIGRSLAFWTCFYPDLQAMFPGVFDDVTLEQFYCGINEVKESLIRVEADELTYNLHIMIRYEIEKGLINEQIRVEDLPEVWNQKMQEYLGLVPANDAEGVLQDVHWAGGNFGYFPSYALGNVYAAQFRNALQRAMPEYKELVRNGDLLPIKEWLREHIYQYGKLLSPAQILRNVTGEEANANDLIHYLEEKYSSIYHLA
jgi:carboxypeptidase Taq